MKAYRKIGIFIFFFFLLFSKSYSIEFNNEKPPLFCLNLGIGTAYGGINSVEFTESKKKTPPLLIMSGMGLVLNEHYILSSNYFSYNQKQLETKNKEKPIMDIYIKNLPFVLTYYPDFIKKGKYFRLGAGPSYFLEKEKNDKVDVKKGICFLGGFGYDFISSTFASLSFNTDFTFQKYFKSDGFPKYTYLVNVYFTTSLYLPAFNF